MGRIFRGSDYITWNDGAPRMPHLLAYISFYTQTSIITINCYFDFMLLFVCFVFFQMEKDVSVRQQAVDLLYAMCDKSNAEEIVQEMLNYLETADYSIREEMVRYILQCKSLFTRTIQKATYK